MIGVFAWDVGASFAEFAGGDSVLVGPLFSEPDPARRRRRRGHCFDVRSYMRGPFTVKRHRVRAHRRCR